jgi:hypothetical protein
MKNKKPVKPGSIRITPEDNRLMEMPPYLNTQITMPRWYKAMRKTAGLKRCAGVNDYLSTGVTIPMWSNLYFRPNPESGWESRIENMDPPLYNLNVQGFSADDTPGCPVMDVRKLENMQYPKIINPWRFETAPGWSSLILPISWEPNRNYDVLPAVVHTDFYHVMNIVLNITTNVDFMIPYGTPMVQIIPFERKNGLSSIDFEDESMFKYVASGGFGSGQIIPSTGTAAPYRRTKHKTDIALQEKKSKRKFFSKKK